MTISLAIAATISVFGNAWLDIKANSVSPSPMWDGRYFSHQA